MSKEFKIGSGETCYLVVCGIELNRYLDDKISASKNLKELQLRILEDEHIIKVIGEVTVNRSKPL